MYDIPNCEECGGDPILYLIRARKLTKVKLEYNQIVEIIPDDMLAVYCSKCEQMIQIEVHTKVQVKEAKK